MRCGLCHEEVGKLSKSHIIPKALHLFGQEKGEHQPLLVMSANEEKRVERSHAGIYSQIVCAKCEGSFHNGDEALIDFCRGHAEGVVIPGGEQSSMVAVEFPKIENGPLHRGIITVLYRAHLSDNDFFNYVELPEKFAEQLRKVLLSPDQTYHSDFDVVLRLVPGTAGSVIKAPQRRRVDGVNTHWLSFPHVIAAVKVDSQTSPTIRRLRIGAHAHPVAAITPELNTIELNAILKVMQGRHEDVVRITGRNGNRSRSKAV